MAEIAAAAVTAEIVKGFMRRIIRIPDEGTSIDEWIINDWVKSLILQQTSSTSDSQRIRRIEKVPQTLRLNEHNKKEYEPMVVSFGPYNHGKDGLHLAEGFKPTSLRIYTSYCDGKSPEDLRKEVLEMIGIVRGCYVEGSTNEYNDEELTQMMLLDGCLVLNLIEWLSRPNGKMLLMYEHLGALGFLNLYRDMFLLENQLPYQVLQVLMSIRFNKEETLEILNSFFNVLLHGEWFQSKKLKATIGRYGEQQPLHLLEIYRALFLSKSGIGDSFSKPETVDKIDLKKHDHSFRSVTDFKAKGILLRPCSSKSGNDISFKSHFLYGRLEIPPMVIDQDTKSTLLNLIAYELCPNNPNDFRVTSYVRFMKSLIQVPEDVKELRTKNILLNSMGGDDEVVTMFKDIMAPSINVLVFDMVEKRIQKHYNSKARTWIAELIAEYFSSPWTAIAFLAAVALLALSIVQTHFTIHPPNK